MDCEYANTISITITVKIRYGDMGHSYFIRLQLVHFLALYNVDRRLA